MPVFFALCYRFFATNSIFYHLVVFCIFAILQFAIFFLFKTIHKKTNIALFITFLYATWSVHFMSISWLSTTSNIIGPLFSLLSISFYLRFLSKKKVKFWLASFSLFLLALASFEFALTIPPIVVAYTLIYKKKIFSNYVWPFFLVNAIYFATRFILFPIPATGQYQLSVNLQSALNLFWFFLWNFNLPEGFKTLMQLNAPKQSFNLIIQYSRITLPATLTIIIFTWLLLKNRKSKLKDYLFGISWFLIAITPVLFLQNHAYTMYLSFAGIGILYIFSSTLIRANKLIWLATAFLWIVASYNTLLFNQANHWLVNQQLVSRTYVKEILNKVKKPDPNAVFVIYDADSTYARENNLILPVNEPVVKQSLNDSDALNAIYNKEGLEAIYLKGDQPVVFPENRQIHIIHPERN